MNLMYVRSKMNVNAEEVVLPLLGTAAGATVCTAVMKANCTSPALEVPTCTARSPHAYDDTRDL
jgi:hypothetical protein